VLALIVNSMDQTCSGCRSTISRRCCSPSDSGLGLLLTVVIVFVTGALASNILGRRLVRFWESILGRIRS